MVLRAHRLLATTIHDALTVGSSMVLVSAHPPEEQVLTPHHYLSPSGAGVGEGSSI